MFSRFHSGKNCIKGIKSNIRNPKSFSHNQKMRLYYHGNINKDKDLLPPKDNKIFYDIILFASVLFLVVL